MTEAKLLQAMANATSAAEQRRYMAQLERLRAERTRQVRADRELDLADTIIRDTLTPVMVHDRHTAASDWIEEEPVSGGDYDRPMRAEATMWFRKVHPAVKADREEFHEQARGMARHLASQFGLDSPAAQRVFLDEVARLHRLANDSPGQRDDEQSGNAESEITDYDTEADQPPYLAEDWEDDGDAGVHPEMPGATGTRKTAEGSFVYKGDAYYTGIVSSHPGMPSYTCEVGGESVENTEAYVSAYQEGESQKVICRWHGLDVMREEAERGRDIYPLASRKRASEGQTCSVCGDSIEKDPASEDPQTWHHNNGEKHDHEAKPSKEAKRTQGAGTSDWKDAYEKYQKRNRGGGTSDWGENYPKKKEDEEEKEASRRHASSKSVLELQPGDVIEGATGNDGQPLTVAAVDGGPGLVIVDFTDGTATRPLTGGETVTVASRKTALNPQSGHGESPLPTPEHPHEHDPDAMWPWEIGLVDEEDSEKEAAKARLSVFRQRVQANLKNRRTQ